MRWSVCAHAIVYAYLIGTGWHGKAASGLAMAAHVWYGRLRTGKGNNRKLCLRNTPSSGWGPVRVMLRIFTWSCSARDQDVVWLGGRGV